jgi:ABC-type transport system substrate-binding protein
MAVYVQAAWSKIGIQADIQTPEPAAFQGIYTGPLKTGQVLMVNFGEWSNFNTSLNVFFPRSQGGFYMPSLLKPGGPSVWDPLLTKSLSTPAPDPVILKQIENAFFDDATMLPLMYNSFIYITKSSLKDTGLTKYGTANAWDYANTYMAK